MLAVNILFWLFNQEQWQTCSRLLEMLQCPQGTAVMTMLKSHSEGGRCHVALLHYFSEFLLHPQEGPPPSNTLPLPASSFWMSNEHFTEHSVQLSPTYHILKFSLCIAQGYIASK